MDRCQNFVGVLTISDHHRVYFRQLDPYKRTHTIEHKNVGKALVHSHINVRNAKIMNISGGKIF